MKKIFRLSAFLLAVPLYLALLASCNRTPADGQEWTGGGDLSDKSLTVMISAMPNAPYQENWAAWRYVREATGANIMINAVPTDYPTKVALAFAASDMMPDLIMLGDKKLVDKYAEQGVLIAIDDYSELLTNYNAFWENVQDEQRDLLLSYRKSSDGKTYFPQVYGRHDTVNLKTWMYRKDIFDKHSISEPQTTDELYEAAVQLKKLYPDSYPVCIRDFFINGINTFGPSWAPGFTWNLYYDYDNDSWHYGAREDTMLEIIKYFKRLNDEKLIPPSFVKMSANEWQELVYTNRTFVFPQYYVQIDLLNKRNRQENPDFNIAAMIPPRAENGRGANKMYKLNIDPVGYVVCNTQKQDSIENSIKLLDWFYTDEAKELLSWGKPNETYVEKNGERVFIVEEGENITAKYGLHSNGLAQLIEKEAVLAFYSDEARQGIEKVISYTEDRLNPAQWVPLTSDEAKNSADIGAAIDAYAQEMTVKFLLGQIPLSDWDTFTNALDGMGVQELIEIYKNAFERVK